MTIKLIIFDLDGVLVDSHPFHCAALNRALNDVDARFVMTEAEHLQLFDGLSTQQTLELLSKQRGLPLELHDRIWQKKQEYTTLVINEMLRPMPFISELFLQLKKDAFQIHVCSNAIRETVQLILLKMNLMQHVDYFLSSQDVLSPKPHPEIYWQAMIKEKVLPTETLIVEDSLVGRTAATLSGAILYAVKSPAEVTVSTLYRQLCEHSS